MYLLTQLKTHTTLLSTVGTISYSRFLQLAYLAIKVKILNIKPQVTLKHTLTHKKHLFKKAWRIFLIFYKNCKRKSTQLLFIWKFIMTETIFYSWFLSCILTNAEDLWKGTVSVYAHLGLVLFGAEPHHNV